MLLNFKISCWYAIMQLLKYSFVLSSVPDTGTGCCFHRTLLAEYTKPPNLTYLIRIVLKSELNRIKDDKIMNVSFTPLVCK